MSGDIVALDERRFNDALEKVVRLALGANDPELLPPKFRGLWNVPDPVIWAGMYHHLMMPSELGELTAVAQSLETALQQTVTALRLPSVPDTTGMDAEVRRVALSAWQHSVASTLSGCMPLAPRREDFPTEEDFDEARGRWQETIGRIKATVARSGCQVASAKKEQDDIAELMNSIEDDFVGPTRSFADMIAAGVKHNGGLAQLAEAQLQARRAQEAASSLTTPTPSPTNVLPFPGRRK